MGFLHWLQANWVDFLQSAAILGGFVTLRRDKKKEIVQNWIKFTERHAELARQQAYDPKLVRIKQTEVNLIESPITPHEDYHVRERIHHLAATHYAEKNGVFVQPIALPEDIRSYFSLPIPKAVWSDAKIFLEPDFVKFVESHADFSS